MNSIQYLRRVPRPLSVDDLAALLPGLLLCLLLTAAAFAAARVEAWLFGRDWIEPVVLAILLGTAVRTAWRPGHRWTPGINAGAKTVLEVAIVLLGATISAGMILRAGAGLVLGIVGVVFAAIAVGYGLGRAFGLPPRMATLIACGNAICGNSAIAAVAPVIDAHSDDVGTSIAFTAVLGVAVVLLLPLLGAALELHPQGFGVLAGLTVYAVPQVLAATAPVGAVAAQMGTFVKLVRVLMLGPVVIVLSLLVRRAAPLPVQAAGSGGIGGIGRWAPWFIVGFVLMLAARSAGWIPGAWIAPLGAVSSWLTVVSMAALGLGVDVRAVARSGPRVVAVVTLSLLALGGLAWGLLELLALNAR